MRTSSLYTCADVVHAVHILLWFADSGGTAAERLFPLLNKFIQRMHMSLVSQALRCASQLLHGFLLVSLFASSYLLNGLILLIAAAHCPQHFHRPV